MSAAKKVYLAAILHTTIIGFSFLFVKLALTAADPLDTLAHRFTLSFLAAAAPLAARRTRLAVRGRQWLAALPLALLYPTAMFSFQAFGLAHTASSEAGVIYAAVPAFTAVLAAYFLKEQTSGRQKFCIALSMAGVVYIFYMKQAYVAADIGAFLILLSALSSACYNVLARKLTRRYPLYDLTFIMTAAGFICFNLAAIIRHAAAGAPAAFFQPLAQPVFLLAVLYLGVLSSLGTSLLANYILARLEASRMSVFSNLSTLITILAGVFFLRESLSLSLLIGAVLILAGVVGAQRFGR